MNIENVPYLIFEDDFIESKLYSLYDDDGLEEIEKMIKIKETKDKAKDKVYKVSNVESKIQLLVGKSSVETQLFHKYFKIEIKRNISETF